MSEDPGSRLRRLAAEVSESYDADVFAYSGLIFEPTDAQVLQLCRERTKKRKNVLLILNTHGGSADAAYRIGRCFQRSYNINASGLPGKGEFYIYVHEICASAGTLLTLGATTLIMSQKAQLGPIDVQLRRDDEVGERRSGLTTRQALETLANEASSAFGRLFNHMRFNRSTQLPTRMAGELAAEMAVRMMEPIYAQIDPMKLGETERYVRISQEYGERLSTPNVKKSTITRLLVSYPSHEFVIDREEAERDLFENVRKPTDALEEVAQAIISSNQSDDRGPFINFIVPELSIPEEADDAQNADPALGEAPAGEKSSSGEVRSEPDGPITLQGEAAADAGPGRRRRASNGAEASSG